MGTCGNSPAASRRFRGRKASLPRRSAQWLQLYHVYACARVIQVRMRSAKQREGRVLRKRGTYGVFFQVLEPIYLRGQPEGNSVFLENYRLVFKGDATTKPSAPRKNAPELVGRPPPVARRSPKGITGSSDKPDLATRSYGAISQDEI